MDQLKEPTKSYDVLIMDLFHYMNQDEEYTMKGFPSLELAKEFSRRFVRKQIEELRDKEYDKKEIKKYWVMFGENAMVLDGSYSAWNEVEYFIDHPATSEEIDSNIILIQAGLEKYLPPSSRIVDAHWELDDPSLY